MQIILGAGMAGCLAAIAFPKATIYEKNPLDKVVAHNAVLRFRDDSVSRFTGIPFKKVTVHKALFYNGEYIPVIIPYLANKYSLKVTGEILDRSIWNLEPVERYIAPPDFHEQILDMCMDRIEFDYDVKGFSDKSTYISTIPMDVMTMLSSEDNDIDFNYRSIYTARYKIDNCNVNQTVYFPDLKVSEYRATITGDNLIVESIDEDYNIDNIIRTLGLAQVPITPVNATKQSYGKIAPIDNNWRKGFLHKLTIEKNIYSLGRFATWRNILLDDVLIDIHKIKSMIDNDSYWRKLNES